MKEPSVLDYVKAKLIFWKPFLLEIPPDVTPLETESADTFKTEAITPLAEVEHVPLPAPPTVERPTEDPLVALKRLPWCSLGALFLALMGQRTLEPPGRSLTQGLVFYAMAAGLLFWAIWKQEWQLSPIPENSGTPEAGTPTGEELSGRPGYDRRISFNATLILGALFSSLAFLAFSGNLFTPLNITLWMFGLGFIIYAYWQPAPVSGRPSWMITLRDWLRRPGWQMNFSRWTVLLLIVAGVAVFFRFYSLNDVPPEMFSDHAEKLLDVYDVLHGETHIFFPRNTGREAFQMYLTAAVISLIGTGYSFLSLKIGTAMAGLLTLPFIYLLGKEIANRRVGLLATFFAGIAYWPNVISRVALRFSLYPFFAAPTIYYLVRGLRTRRRNDFILSGLFLGIGLHGYSPFRVVPFIVVIAVGLYLLHRQSKHWRKEAVVGLVLLALISLVVFLPLLRYALETPEMFYYRTMTRLGSVEQPLPGQAWQIFQKNTWNALTMFAWDDGEIWVHSVPHRPALDVVSSALFYIGLLLLLVRYLRHRHWLDLFLLLSIPLFLLPSILSLAFPGENPSLNRTGAALIPVFLVVGLTLDSLLEAIKVSAGKLSASAIYRWVGVVLTAFLVSWALMQNYALVFNQYQDSFRMSAWNTSEIGRVIRGFADSVGQADRAWVIPYPQWVDTRLVGINAGYPTTDYARWSQDIPQTLDLPETKLFILKPDDSPSLQILREFYPEGILQRYVSKTKDKDFYMYLVPAKPNE